MRKLSLAFLISLMTVPAMADNWIKFKAQAVEDAINTLVAQEKRVATKNEYEKQMDQTTGKISVMGIYKVCAAAGNDIRTNNGYSQCRYFINQIAEKSGFGTKSANQAKCANKFNGVWTLSADGKAYQCVGKDGYQLVYKKSCESEDANSKCIKDFSSLKTTGPVGREFIIEYGNKKNLKLTCYTGFETRRSLRSPFGQDYIRCSAGGKSYEFEFDSLNQDPGKTSVESENKAMCEFFGGKIVKHPDSSVEKFWQSCDISQDVCEGKLHRLALRIGHTTMYHGYCRFSREAESTDYANLHTIKGVDSKIFYNSGAQMRSDMAKVQLEEYLHNTFPNESHIVCDPTAKKFNYGLGINPDYVMTCTVGLQQVDFLFHDLTEGRKSRADTGMDAMQCIISGGTFKGESCRGPTKAECDKLDAALRAKGSTEGAKWDDDVRACIMGNAMKTYKRDVTTGYIVGAVVIIGGTIAVIGTGGAALPAIIGGAEILVTDLAINWAIDANHRRLSKGAATRFGDFIEDADKCTDEQCALQVLKKHYKSLSGVIDDLNTEDHATIDAVMDRLIGLIQTEFVACGTDDAGQVIMASPADCAMQKSRLRAIDYFGEWTEFALVVGSIVIPAGYFTNKFMKLKKVSKLAKLDDTTDAAVVTGSKIKNPTQWKPGEDVAEYMDVEKLQSKLDDIDKQLALKQLAKNGKKVSNADDALKIPAGNFATSALDGAKQKLVALGGGIDDFDGLINNVVHADAPFPGHWTRNTLSDEEFDALTSWFKTEHNLTLNVDDYGILKIDRPSNGGASSIAALKAKYRSGKTTSSFDISQLTTNNNIATTGTGFRVADDGKIIREIPTTSQGIKDPIVVPKGQMSAPTQGVDLDELNTQLQDAEIRLSQTPKKTDATRATTNAATDGARTTNATADAARTTSRATNATSDAIRNTHNASDLSTTSEHVPKLWDFSDIIKEVHPDLGQKNIREALDEFIAAPYSTKIKGMKHSMRPDVMSAIAREMAIEDGVLFLDPYLLEDPLEFAQEIAKQSNALRSGKAMTAAIEMGDELDDVLNSQQTLTSLIKNMNANGIERASIPFSSKKHAMLLVKESDKYTILDQFGNIQSADLFTDELAVKNKVVNALKKAGVKQDNIIMNDYNMCKNETGTCAIYTNLSAQAALDTDELFDLVREHNRTRGQSTRWGGDIIEGLVMESADLLVEYAKKALKRF